MKRVPALSLRFHAIATISESIPISISVSRLSTSVKCPMNRGAQKDPIINSGKSFGSIPGPPIYPFIGSVWDLKRRMSKGKQFFEVVKDYRDEYGPIVKAKIFEAPSVFIHDPQEFLKG